MSKISAFEWLFIAALAIIAIGLICKLPDADAPVDHDFGDFATEQEQTPITNLPKSTPPIVQTGYQESTEAEEPDVYPDDNEDELIVAALYASGYFREDVPLDYILQDHLRTACEAYHVPFELALGVIEVESGFSVDADSGVAKGLFQLHKSFYPSETMTPEENIYAGVKTLAEKYKEYGYWEAALTSYNVGFDNGSRTYAEKVIRAAVKWGWRP